MSAIEERKQFCSVRGRLLHVGSTPCIEIEWRRRFYLIPVKWSTTSSATLRLGRILDSSSSSSSTAFVVRRLPKTRHQCKVRIRTSVLAPFRVDHRLWHQFRPHIAYAPLHAHASLTLAHLSQVARCARMLVQVGFYLQAEDYVEASVQIHCPHMRQLLVREIVYGRKAPEALARMGSLMFTASRSPPPNDEPDRAAFRQIQNSPKEADRFHAWQRLLFDLGNQMLRDVSASLGAAATVGRISSIMDLFVFWRSEIEILCATPAFRQSHRAVARMATAWRMAKVALHKHWGAENVPLLQYLLWSCDGSLDATFAISLGSRGPQVANDICRFSVPSEIKDVAAPGTLLPLYMNDRYLFAKSLEHARRSSAETHWQLSVQRRSSELIGTAAPSLKLVRCRLTRHCPSLWTVWIKCRPVRFMQSSPLTLELLQEAHGRGDSCLFLERILKEPFPDTWLWALSLLGMLPKEDETAVPRTTTLRGDSPSYLTQWRSVVSLHSQLPRSLASRV